MFNTSTCAFLSYYNYWICITAIQYSFILQNGALSAIPYICGAFMAFATAHIADFFRSKKILTTTQTRRSFQTAGTCRLRAFMKFKSLQFKIDTKIQKNGAPIRDI